jgi:superkiller protein 3
MFDVFKPTKKKAEKLFREAMNSGNWGPAINYYQQYVDKNSRDYEAHNDLGWMLLQVDHPEEALEHFDAAIELEEDPTHYNNRGQALLKLERFEEANEALDRALELDPDDPEPAYYKAVGLRLQDDLEGCMAALDAVLENDPEFAPALMEYAVCLQEDERPEESVEYLERAIDDRPMWIPARLNAVNTLCDLARYPAATSHLEAIDEMGTDVVVELGDDDLTITINGQVVYEGEYDDTVPGFGG